MKSDVEIDRNALGKLLNAINPFIPYDSLKSDTRKRPLQGLSPYVINAGLLYQGPHFGFNIAYNRFGKRVILTAPEEYNDVYEAPRNVIDVQLFTRIARQKIEIKLNVSDLLHENFVQYNNSDTKRNGITTGSNSDPNGLNYNSQHDFIYYQGNKGTNVTLSVSYKF